MKQPKSDAKPRTLLDPKKFLAHAQSEATAGRKHVREAAHPVTAPRQSLRADRKSKSRTGV